MDRRSFFRLPAVAALVAVAPRVFAAPTMIGVDLAAAPDKWVAVSYNGTTWDIVGESGKTAATSPDGISWTAR